MRSSIHQGPQLPAHHAIDVIAVCRKDVDYSSGVDVVGIRYQASDVVPVVVELFVGVGVADEAFVAILTQYEYSTLAGFACEFWYLKIGTD